MDEILEPGGLHTLFQPIVDIAATNRSLHAIEALSRGPKDTNMEFPDVLFEYVERRCSPRIVRSLPLTLVGIGKAMAARTAVINADGFLALCGGHWPPGAELTEG